MAAAEITRSATEQPDVNMDCIISSLTCLDILAGVPVSATEQPDPAMDSSLAAPIRPTKWIPAGMAKLEIHVSFNNDMWWAMPHELSDPILQQWTHGAQQVSFIWDWKAARKGSYQPDGAETSINRYIIDFDTMYQRNTDNNRMRKVKIVEVIQQGNATESIEFKSTATEHADFVHPTIS